MSIYGAINWHKLTNESTIDSRKLRMRRISSDLDLWDIFFATARYAVVNDVIISKHLNRVGETIDHFGSGFVTFTSLEGTGRVLAKSNQGRINGGKIIFDQRNHSKSSGKKERMPNVALNANFPGDECFDETEIYSAFQFMCIHGKMGNYISLKYSSPFFIHDDLSLRTFTKVKIFTDPSICSPPHLIYALSLNQDSKKSKQRQGSLARQLKEHAIFSKKVAKIEVDDLVIFQTKSNGDPPYKFWRGRVLNVNETGVEVFALDGAFITTLPHSYIFSFTAELGVMRFKAIPCSLLGISNPTSDFASVFDEFISSMSESETFVAKAFAYRGRTNCIRLYLEKDGVLSDAGRKLFNMGVCSYDENSSLRQYSRSQMISLKHSLTTDLHIQ